MAACDDKRASLLLNIKVNWKIKLNLEQESIMIFQLIYYI